MNAYRLLFYISVAFIASLATQAAHASLDRGEYSIKTYPEFFVKCEVQKTASPHACRSFWQRFEKNSRDLERALNKSRDPKPAAEKAGKQGQKNKSKHNKY